jgi:outer membrane cobalamin receptor
MAADLLRQVPGLQVVETGQRGGLTSLYTRGSQRTGTLVLLDGVPLNDPGGEVNLASLGSGDIGRVEAIRGPESAVFGAEAAAGVVQLFTRQGDPENTVPRGALSYERGNLGTDAWQASLSGGSGYRLDYALHAEQLRTTGEPPNGDYRGTAGSANIGLRIAGATQLRGVFRVADSVVGAPGQTAYGLFDPEARETNRDSSLSLRLDDARGSHFVQQLSFGYHRMRDVYADTVMEGPFSVAALVRDVAEPEPRTYLVRLLDPNQLPAGIPTGTRLVTSDVTLYPAGVYLSATSRARLSYQATAETAGVTTVFGYDFERQAGEVSGSNVNRDNNGFFIHGRRTLAGRLYLSAGVSVEHSSAYGRKITPRGAIGLQISGQHGALPSTFLRLSAGGGITEPSLIQNFSRESYAVGNPNLRPERTTSYEAGLVQEWMGRRATSEVGVFDNSFRDLITYVSLPPPVWGSWRNVEASRARGLEVSGRARLVGSVTLTASYTRLWTRIVTSNNPSSPFLGVGQELAKRPRNSGSVSLSIAPRRWWIQAGAVFVGERQDPDFVFGVTRNPGFQNVFASGSYRLSRHFSPFFRAGNMLNSRYQEVLGYRSRPRTASLGIRVEW